MARELAAWRERTAAEEDRPVGSVLRDPTVVELAKRQPSGRRELAQIRGVNPDVVRRRGSAVLEAIARGKEAEPVHLDDGDRLQTESVDGPVIALAESLVRSRAQEAGLAYELIAARADLAPIVVAARRGAPEPDVRTLQRLAPRARRRRAARAAGGRPHARRRRRRPRPGPRGLTRQRRSGRVSTTSKSRPVRRPSACSWSLSQRGCGAPEMYQSEPLSATISP